MPKTIAIGLLGPTLDRGQDPSRWEHWRPTVSLFQQEDLVIDRFHLLSQAKFPDLTKTVAKDIAAVSPETQVERVDIRMPNPWDFEGVYAELHDVAQQVTPTLADDDELLVHITTGSHVAQICLFLLTESRHLPGKLIQTMPPRSKSPKRGGGHIGNRIAKGPGRYTVIDLDLSQYDKIAQRFKDEKRQGQALLKQGIPTVNPAFNAMIDQIETVALQTRDPILLTGPTGAGKTRLARRVHALKDQKRQLTGPLVEVNCATLRGDQAMSTLFGHKKGAFTGAAADRHGLLAEANGGLLFLDEIGELGLDEQAMLLHAIEDQRFIPLGSDRPVTSDFQLICGTNANLTEAVSQGRFREDLFARINLWSFHIPGLADRRDDIAPNLAFELQRVGQKLGKNLRFNKQAEADFLSFAQSPSTPWRGNFRDLAAAVTRMGTLAHAARITQQDVQAETHRLLTTWAPAPGTPGRAQASGCGTLGQPLPPAGAVDKQSTESGGSFRRRVSDPCCREATEGASLSDGRSTHSESDAAASIENQRSDNALLIQHLGQDQAEALDLFDRAQLATVIRICLASKSPSDAGRSLFAISREKRKTVNDADRLRKYLAKFGLNFQAIQKQTH